MANYTVEAIILRGFPFRDRDRIYSLFTPNKGIVKAIGKGVLATGSKLSGYLDLFSHSKVFLAEGKSLDIITQVSPISSNKSLLSDLESMSYSYKLAELLLAVIGEEEHYDVFRLMKELLYEGGIKSTLKRSVLVYHLFSVLGYKPNATSCALSGSKLGDVAYWSEDHFGFVSPRFGSRASSLKVSRDSLAFFRALESGRYESLSLDKNDLIDVQRIYSKMIESILDRESKSASFYNHINTI